MNKQKKLWEELARKNSRYYINTDKGKGITEKEFRISGFKDIEKYIGNEEFPLNKWTILEIGCGIGRMTAFLSMLFKRVIAIDISGEMIRQAKDRLKYVSGHSNIKLIETDGETIPVDDDSVDFAFSYLVFQHMKTREMVEKNFQEVYRVLNRGGLFKVLLRADKQESLDSWWSGVSYDKKSVEELADRIGFTVRKLQPVGTHGLWVWLWKI